MGQVVQLREAEQARQVRHAGQVKPVAPSIDDVRQHMVLLGKVLQ